MARASSCTSSPYRARPPIIILKPLYLGGLWLPVMATPEPVCMVCAAKYTSGVGTWPISSVSMPCSSMPSCSAVDSISLLSRPSRPDQRLDAGLAGVSPRRAQRAGEAGVDQVGHCAADVIGLEYRSGEWRGGAHAGSFGGEKAGEIPGLDAAKSIECAKSDYRAIVAQPLAQAARTAGCGLERRAGQLESAWFCPRPTAPSDCAAGAVADARHPKVIRLPCKQKDREGLWLQKFPQSYLRAAPGTGADRPRPRRTRGRTRAQAGHPCRGAAGRRP